MCSHSLLDCLDFLLDSWDMLSRPTGFYYDTRFVEVGDHCTYCLFAVCAKLHAIETSALDCVEESAKPGGFQQRGGFHQR
jgi:hypothetical protein